MSHISARQQAPQSAESLSMPTGLTDSDVIRTLRVMRLLLKDWNLDRNEDCHGVLSLIITPETDRDDAPAFALHLDEGEIQAGVVLADTYALITRTRRVEDAVRAVAEYLRDRHSIAA